MSVQSRSDKIKAAMNSVIFTSKKTGMVRDYRFSFGRLNNQTVKFGKREIAARVYQTDCRCQDNACLGNSSHTVCYHVLAAYSELMRLAGFTVYKVDNANHAYKLINLGCGFVKLLNNNGQAVVVGIKRNSTDERQAMENVKQLLGSNRLALQKSGDVMPIAYKVELYRRNDDTFALRSGSVTSKPIVRYGRNTSVTDGIEGIWKFTIEADRNWRQFADKAFGPRVLADGSLQTEQQRHQNNLQQYFRMAG